MQARRAAYRAQMFRVNVGKTADALDTLFPLANKFPPVRAGPSRSADFIRPMRRGPSFRLHNASAMGSRPLPVARSDGGATSRTFTGARPVDADIAGTGTASVAGVLI